MDLKNKLAIVTGASTGIGKAISIELAKEGAKVFLLARTEERLQETKKLIEKVRGEWGFISKEEFERNDRQKADQIWKAACQKAGVSWLEFDRAFWIWGVYH